MTGKVSRIAVRHNTATFELSHRQSGTIQYGFSASANTSFLDYIHQFRGFSILIIILGHCIDAFDWSGQDVLFRILSLSLKGGSIYFLFISGFLFKYLSNRFIYTSYLLSKLKNIIVPYIMTSIPALIFFTCYARKPLLDQEFYELHYAQQIFIFLTTGSHLATLWFIPMMAIFYLVAPLLLLLEKRNLLYFGLPLFIALSIWTPKVHPAINNFFHFLPIYIVGMYCAKYESSIIVLKAKYKVSLLGLYVFSMIYFISSFSIQPFAYLLIVRVFACLVFLLIFHAVNHSSSLMGLSLRVLANFSFGLYFVHPYLISGLRYIYTSIIGGIVYTSELYLYYPIFSCFIIALSFIVLKSFQFIFGKHSRYLIGA